VIPVARKVWQPTLTFMPSSAERRWIMRQASTRCMAVAANAPVRPIAERNRGLLRPRPRRRRGGIHRERLRACGGPASHGACRLSRAGEPTSAYRWRSRIRRDRATRPPSRCLCCRAGRAPGRSPDDVLRAADGVGRVDGEHAGDEPVEAQADGASCYFYHGLGPFGGRAPRHIGSDVERIGVEERADLVSLDPGGELRHRPVIGRGVPVADGGGEEFEEAAGGGSSAAAVGAGSPPQRGRKVAARRARQGGRRNPPPSSEAGGKRRKALPHS
jgi:hypothetical protein